jgi:hypothetical protein
MNARFHDVALTLRGTQCRRESDSRQEAREGEAREGAANAGKRAPRGGRRR